MTLPLGAPGTDVERATPATFTGLYRPRRPERSVLYQVVQMHLETFLSLLREADPDADPVPRHVERTFRKYLDCGIFALGFARVRCPACGYDSFVAH